MTSEASGAENPPTTPSVIKSPKTKHEHVSFPDILQVMFQSVSFELLSQCVHAITCMTTTLNFE